MYGLTSLPPGYSVATLQQHCVVGPDGSWHLTPHAAWQHHHVQTSVRHGGAPHVPQLGAPLIASCDVMSDAHDLLTFSKGIATHVPLKTETVPVALLECGGGKGSGEGGDEGGAESGITSVEEVDEQHSGVGVTDSCGRVASKRARRCKKINVNDKVSVHWSAEKRDFLGTVVKVGPKASTIQYDDGDKYDEWNSRINVVEAHIRSCSTPGCTLKLYHLGVCGGRVDSRTRSGA